MIMARVGLLVSILTARKAIVYLRASSRGVEVCKTNAAIVGKLVDVGGPDLAAEAAYIGEAQVVCNCYEEVGAFRRHG